MISAFGVEHGVVSKRLSRAAQRGLQEITRGGKASKGIVGSKGEYAQVRLTRHYQGRVGNPNAIRAGKDAKHMEKDLLYRASHGGRRPLKKPKPLPAGMRGSLKQRGLIKNPNPGRAVPRDTRVETTGNSEFARRNRNP